MKRILIVNVNWIGDVIFSTPFIRAVREAYPDAYIACLIHPRTREVLELNPRLDELIVYDEEGAHWGPIGKLRLSALLRAKRFDAAFILHRSFTKAFITRLAGIPLRIGYAAKRGRGSVLTLALPEPVKPVHKVEYFLDLARAAGITPQSLSYEFCIDDADRVSVGDFLRKHGADAVRRLVVLCPGGNWDRKRWPAERFTHLADRLIEELRATVILSGAEKDSALVEGIRQKMRHQPIVSCGKTSLRQLAALFQRAKLVVANDSGPMHLAVSMGAPVIALFGPTANALTGPYGGGDYRVIFKNDTCAVPCYDFTCSDSRCMAAITVDEVIKEARDLLNRAGEVA